MSIPSQIKGTPICFFNQIYDAHEFNYVLVNNQGYNYEYLIGIDGKELYG